MKTKTKLLFEKLSLTSDNLDYFLKLKGYEFVIKEYSFILDLYDDNLSPEENYLLIVPFLIEECFVLSRYFSEDHVSDVKREVLSFSKDYPILAFFYYFHLELDTNLDDRLSQNFK